MERIKAWVPFGEFEAADLPLEVGRFPSSGDQPEGFGVRLVALPHPFVRESVDVLRGLPDLEVVQLLSSGTEHVSVHLPEGLRLCNAPNLHAQPTAEVAMSLILASLNHVPDWVQGQHDRRWLTPPPRPRLVGKTVLIVGAGAVSDALAAMLAGFEVDLVRVARRERPGVVGVDRLRDLLPSAHVAVLAAPLTDETRGIFGDDMLGAMRDGALLVNVARGPLVDTDALLQHVRGGRIRAALDVTDPEPLPSDHELWSCPGVLVSPHVGGDTADFRERAVAFLAVQLKRFAAGEPLLNEVYRASHAEAGLRAR